MVRKYKIAYSDWVKAKNEEEAVDKFIQTFVHLSEDRTLIKELLKVIPQ
jgi:3-methyladenine DNA glycosylase AlkD